MADLVIKINGDVKGFSDALSEVEKQSQDLTGALSTTAKTAGLAFAALTAEIGVSVAAFNESRAASNALQVALQNQGIFTKDLIETYGDYAKAVQLATGLDDDSVTQAQASIQALIGQTAITKNLTFAIADLSQAKKIDLESAAELIGKGINGQTAALKKLGIEVDDALTKEQRMASIIEQVNQKFGGQAAAANAAGSGIRGLQSAFGDVQEEIGKRFAPAVDAAAAALTKMLNFIANNPAIIDFGVSVLGAAAAVTGLITIIGTAGLAFFKLKAALEAARIATAATTIAVKGLVGATGLGLLLIVAAEIYLNWESIWPRMQAIFEAFSQNIIRIGKGVGEVILGIFTANPSLIKQGLEDAKAAFIAASEDYNSVVDKKLKEREVLEKNSQDRQLAGKKDAADKEAAEDARLEGIRLERIKAENELKAAEVDNGSKQIIELKKAEIEALKQLEEAKTLEDQTALIDRVESLREMQTEQDALDLEARKAFQEQILANNEEFQALSEEQKALFLEQHMAGLIGQLETEKSINMKAAEEKLQQQIAANNKFLAEQKKFGTAYAQINEVMNSEVYKGTKNAFGELAALQNSENKELKAIGKAAAVANIIIKTAESAMNIYAGFATIPIIGPALGVAGAAAAVAYGAEQIGKVTAANTGGIITGGIPGIDSVPAMLTPGELVVPERNFEEVVNATRSARQGGGPGAATVELILRGDLAELIEARIIERENLGLSLRVAT